MKLLNAGALLALSSLMSLAMAGEIKPFNQTSMKTAKASPGKLFALATHASALAAGPAMADPLSGQATIAPNSRSSSTSRMAMATLS